MSPDSGRASATTTTVTHGGNSATPETELATRRSRCPARRDPARDPAQPPAAGLARTPAGPARRRAADRRRWLHRAAQLLHRLGAAATGDRADRGAPGRR